MLFRSAQASLLRHPDWVGQALPVVTRLLSASSPSAGEMESLRAFVVAFHQHPAVAALVAQSVRDEIHTAESLRVVLLEAMSRTARDKLPASWRDAFVAALSSKSVPVRTQALRGVNALRLDGMDAPLRAVARDGATGDSLRVKALRSLANRQTTLEPDAFAVLLRELAPGLESSRRLAAVEVLGAAPLSNEQLARFIKAVAGDAMVPPASVIGAIPRSGLSPETAGTLLDYLGASVKAGWQIPEPQIAAVEAAMPSERAKEMKALRAESERAVQTQREQLMTLEPLLHAGDTERGRVVFERKAGCANCHQVGGQGGVLGPDLTKIGAIRAGRDLIESIVMPSATFAQGYETYSATLRNGDTVTGIRVRQSDDTIVLRDASGAETRLPASEGASIERQKLSLMPEGLLGALSESEIRDLLAYLQSLK